MNRFLTLACTLALVGYTELSEGTSQMEIHHRAILKNVCGFPVHISIPRLDFFDPVDKVLNPGESAIVMLYSCPDQRGFFTIQSSRFAVDDLSSCLRDDYDMTIRANGKELHIDAAKMLKIIIEKAERQHDYYFFDWILKDKSLCPGN